VRIQNAGVDYKAGPGTSNPQGPFRLGLTDKNNYYHKFTTIFSYTYRIHNTESQTMSESHGILRQTVASTCWHNYVRGLGYLHWINVDQILSRCAQTHG